jgi:fumarylacetoacetase
MTAAALNATHDPSLRSWVDSANRPQADFPIQNLPYAVFRRSGSHEAFRVGVAIGDQVLDLAAVSASGLFSGTAVAEAVAACAAPVLNDLMSLGHEGSAALRAALSQVLAVGSSHIPALERALVPMAAVEYSIPARIGDYTDFYSSIHHATAVGRLFRPDNPLLPNYKWVPIAYHGRASSIGISGAEICRPSGQVLLPGSQTPVVAPSSRLDYELELGVFIGEGNPLGSAVAIGAAEDHLFGLCLLNDWSARDVQAWEYQPLGPFLSKNFATTLSPWIVTLEALAPFRTAWLRPSEDPQPLPYLDSAAVRACGAIDIQLEVKLETVRMRERHLPPQRLSVSSFRHAYWTVAQMVAHHTLTGCNLGPGDLLGTGTQSGPEAEQGGSLLELTAGGKRPLALASGESRTFLSDGDRVIFRGWCESPTHVRIGFGEVAGTIVPCPNSSHVQV